VPDQVAPNNQPQHKVTLSSYYLMKYFVTFAQYDLYTKLIKGPWINTVPLRFHSKERSPNYPVQGVNWYQANGYCAYLKKLTGLPFSLPTEAQWEYAARSRGKDVEWATDDGTETKTNGGKESDQSTVNYQYAVNRFPPNPLGFYAMGDTVPEWTQDWDHDYTSKTQVNPQGPKTGKYKISRGGGVGSTDSIGIYSRQAVKPDGSDTNSIAGFRCVINSGKPMSELKQQVFQRIKNK
jgi:formylglycine-generating enzyme required for sulfatase activity